MPSKTLFKAYFCYKTIYTCLFLFLFFFIVIPEFLVEAKDINRANLSVCNFFDNRSSCNSYSTDANDSTMMKNKLRPTNALFQTGETVTIPVEYNPNGFFVVKLGLGTPPQTLTFLILTTLDVSWTLCQDCFTCKKQKFYQSNSSTFREASCNPPSCFLGYYNYIDDDSTIISGDLSTDALFLNEREVVSGFVFGCSNHYFTPPNTYAKGVDGYFGLGTGPDSFLSKTVKKYSNTFSYCLPLHNSSGFLLLGEHGSADASKPPQFIPLSKTAPLRTSISLTNYVLDLIGVSVGSKYISVKSSQQKPLPFLLDTGTSVTRFSSEIYKALRNDFRMLMLKYRILSRSPSKVLDTCFNISGETNLSVPPIVFTFSNGVVLPLASSGILYKWSSTVFCFPFTEAEDGRISIFGTLQQRTFEIIYDNPNKRIGFIVDGCSRSTV